MSINQLDDLKALFEFTDEDLAANRAGRLSQRQQIQLRQDALNASIEKGAAIVTLSLMPLAAILFILFGLRYGDALGPLILVAIIIWFSGWAALYRFTWKLACWLLRRRTHTMDAPLLRRLGAYNSQAVHALESGVVERIAGRLSFPTDGEHMFVMSDDIQISINVAAEDDERLWKLRAGQRYAIYRLPDASWIIAVEPL
jgi:hypothetical protein